MKNFLRGKFATVLIIFLTIVLAGVAIFTAIRLYQLRNQAVAPNAPSSQPAAAEIPSSCTALAFTIGTGTPTATPTGTATATPTGTATATPTGTGTPTATPNPSGTPNSCGGTCGSNANCSSNLICYQGFCRNPSCAANTDCVCTGATATPTSQPSLPNSGTGWPTVFGIGVGVVTILGSLLLAL